MRRNRLTKRKCPAHEKSDSSSFTRAVAWQYRELRLSGSTATSTKFGEGILSTTEAVGTSESVSGRPPTRFVNLVYGADNQLRDLCADQQRTTTARPSLLRTSVVRVSRHRFSSCGRKLRSFLKLKQPVLSGATANCQATVGSLFHISFEFVSHAITQFATRVFAIQIIARNCSNR